MGGSCLWRVLTLGVVFSGFACPALAQSEERDHTTGYNAIIDNIDLLVDNYTRFLARKYDLTHEQDEYTKFLLRERSYEFLDRHEENLRELVNRLFDVRTGGEMTPAELTDWGQRVKPIYDDAKKLIINGNNEWREILTPAQTRIHDEDLNLMYQSFETTEEQLERIVSGEMTVEEFRSPPRRPRKSSRSETKRPAPPPQGAPAASSPPPVQRRAGPTSPPPQDSPRRDAHVIRPAPEAKRTEPKVRERHGERSEPKPEPTKATGGRTPAKRAAPKSSGKQSESAWEKYVREFIARYKLNDEQAQKAHAVLDDCQSQADRYLLGRQAELEKLDRQVEGLKKSKDKQKSKKLSALTNQRNKLMAPIDRIFENQLKPRLERLPTRAQRRAAELAAKKKPASKKPLIHKPTKKKKDGSSDGEKD